MKSILFLIVGLLFIGINLKHKERIKNFKGNFIERNSASLFGSIHLAFSILFYLSEKYEVNIFIYIGVAVILMILGVKLIKPIKKLSKFLE